MVPLFPKRNAKEVQHNTNITFHMVPERSTNNIFSGIISVLLCVYVFVVVVARCSLLFLSDIRNMSTYAHIHI